jgi:acyl carrier protein
LSLLSEAAFLSWLADSLLLDEKELSLGADLQRDVGLDSLGMFELVVALEDIGVEVEVEECFR